MAQLVSPKVDSPSPTLAWVTQDVKILFHHFKNDTMVSYLQQAESSLQLKDTQLLRKVKTDNDSSTLTGKLTLLAKRVTQNFQVTTLDKPDKQFTLFPRISPTFNNCFTSRDQYELLYKAVSFYYSLKVSGEVRTFATEKQIENHGYVHNRQSKGG